MRRWAAFSVCVALGLAQADAAHAQDVSDPAGWGWFGGELGFLGGGTASVALTMAALAGDEPESTEGANFAPLLGVATLTLTIGGTVLGAWGFHGLAGDGHWNRDAGWGAAGIFPGIWEGLAISAGALMVAERDPPVERRLAAGIGGMVAGALAGYALFHQMSAARGGAAWETVMFWLGFMTGEVAGIAAADGPGDDHLVLLGAAAGGAVATIATHLIVRAVE